MICPVYKFTPPPPHPPLANNLGGGRLISYSDWNVSCWSSNAPTLIFDPPSLDQGRIDQTILDIIRRPFQDPSTSLFKT
jgi:hypothetical protein